MTTGFQQQSPLGTFTIPKSAPIQQNGQRPGLLKTQTDPAKPPRSFQPRPGLT